MKVVGFSGFSGSGKTTLLEQLIGRLRGAGQRVSVVKHAHHDFEIDLPGKDSYRLRHAGAFETVIASDRRLAKIREYESQTDPTVHRLIAELCECDWVLVEGFKHAELPKIEVWRGDNGKPVQYPHDPYVVAVVTDDARRLPEPTRLPLLNLNDPDAVIRFLLADPARYEYRSPDANAQGATAAADTGRSTRPAAERDPAAG